MTVTAESLPRHELNGLRVQVVEAADSGMVGIGGRVVVETAQTLHIEDRTDGATRVRQVPKQGATFEFELESDPTVRPDAPTAEATESVTVEGSRLLARPARRTERTGEPRWR